MIRDWWIPVIFALGFLSGEFFMALSQAYEQQEGGQ